MFPARMRGSSAVPLPLRRRARCRGAVPLLLGFTIPSDQEGGVGGCHFVQDYTDDVVGEEALAPNRGVKQPLGLLTGTCMAEY